MSTSQKALAVYLNDHLAGAMLGSDLARQIRSRNQGSPLGTLMESLAPQIEEDRQALLALMGRMGVASNPVKQAGARMTERFSRMKFWGLLSGEPEIGPYMALETLTLGVFGKLSLWQALAGIADQYPPVAALDLDGLIDRARNQYERLEDERLSAARRAFALDSAALSPIG